MRQWQTGDVVVFRDMQRGRVLWEAKHIVVHDHPLQVALYICPGAPRRWPAGIRDGDGRQGDNLLAGRWTLVSDVWQSNHILRLYEPGAAHSVEVHWADETWRFKGWYVNLQDPLRRTEDGFESTDYALDIVVDAEGRWSWKDEDDLVELVHARYLTEAQAAAVREEGERVIERIESWAPPFCDNWSTWRPAQAWIDGLKAETTLWTRAN